MIKPRGCVECPGVLEKYFLRMVLRAVGFTGTVLRKERSGSHLSLEDHQIAEGDFDGIVGR